MLRVLVLGDGHGHCGWLQPEDKLMWSGLMAPQYTIERVSRHNTTLRRSTEICDDPQRCLHHLNTIPVRQYIFPFSNGHERGNIAHVGLGLVVRHNSVRSSHSGTAAGKHRSREARARGAPQFPWGVVPWAPRFLRHCPVCHQRSEIPVHELNVWPLCGGPMTCRGAQTRKSPTCFAVLVRVAAQRLNTETSRAPQSLSD